MPQQKNDDDCGVFALAFLESEVLGGDLEALATDVDKAARFLRARYLRWCFNDDTDVVDLSEEI